MKRAFLVSSLALAAVLSSSLAVLADDNGLPDPEFDITLGNTALLVTDPQNDFLHPDGVT